MVIPIVLGALITVVLYATRPKPAVVRSLRRWQRFPTSKDATERVIVIQPKTTEQVRVPLGSSVEIVLLPGLGEAVESENPDILAAIANPPCHLTALCGFPGAEVWTFRTIHAAWAT